jgi:hypothetical protein
VTSDLIDYIGRLDSPQLACLCVYLTNAYLAAIALCIKGKVQL